MAEKSVEAIPRYLTAEPVAPEASWEKGSLGSVVLALQGGDPDVLKATAECYAKRFRKQWQNLRDGLAVFVAPSRAHERHSRESSGLVESLCEAMGLPVVALASTTLHGRESGKSGDPDESFYVGEKAAVCLHMRRTGMPEADIDAWADGQPADLVVEVEHTHYERTKRSLYRDAGVTELWEIATQQAGRDTAIIHLHGAGGPEPFEASEVMPGVRADGIEDALEMLRTLGGYGEFMRRMGRGEPTADALLEAVGVEGRNEEPGTDGP